MKIQNLSLGRGRHKWRPYNLSMFCRGAIHRALVSACSIIVICATSAFAQSQIPAPLKNVDIEQLLGAQVPLETPFKNEKGQEVRISDLLNDKPAILTLVYYECPMLCTQVLNGLVTSLRPIPFTPGQEFNIITISFDPGETAALASAKKEAYLKQYGKAEAEQGWHFLTGSQESITQLTSSVGFKYSYDEKIDQYAHASVIMVLTPEGKIARYFYGIEYPSRDLRWALVDASSKKIGTIADKILLYCFHYDATLGKYSAQAVNLIRVGGVITVLALGGFILRMRRKDKTENHHV
jgi:protein SCO1